jgi:toxin ParE1/3/4
MRKAEYRLSPKAIEDLAEIWNYLSSLNEPAADALMERIHLKLMSTLDFPLQGSPRPRLGPKARILLEGEYVIVYEPAGYGLHVVAVAHARKRPENWLTRKIT